MAKLMLFRVAQTSKREIRLMPQEPYNLLNQKANANLIKYAQESFIQDDILWTRMNKEEKLQMRSMWIDGFMHTTLDTESGRSRFEKEYQEKYFPSPHKP